MRLFHVSEKNKIDIFNPRYPSRGDIEPSIGLVWAINEVSARFSYSKDCPRVA